MKTRLCKRCGEQHELFYRVHEGGAKHMLYRCTKTREFFGVPMIEGLAIPTVLSKKAQKEKDRSLFEAPATPKPPTDYTVTIRFDGGCEGNPGRKYGSYVITDAYVTIAEESRFELGTGTNNEAEFEALIRALGVLNQTSKRTGVDITTTALLVLTDSMIVRNRLMGTNKVHKKEAWRERSEVMFNLANQCLEIMREFHSFTVQWQGRAHNVAVFGH